MLSKAAQGSILLVGLGALAVAKIIYSQNTPQSELARLKAKIESCYQRCKVLLPLRVEKRIQKQEMGIYFTLKIVSSLAYKSDYYEQSPVTRQKDPLSRPFEKGVFVQKLGEEHYLLLNKFPVFKSHVLVVTKDYIRQDNANTKSDLFQTYKVMLALNGYAFFNSTQEAGASQMHKHLQVLPEEALKESDILRMIEKTIHFDQDEFKLQKVYRLSVFQNIRHFIRPIDSTLTNRDLLEAHIYDQYVCLLKDISGKSFLTNESITTLKYNLIMGNNFMMIVQRRKEKYSDQISINAIGFSGSLLVKNTQQYKIFESVKIVKVLEDVSVIESECLPTHTWI